MFVFNEDYVLGDTGYEVQRVSAKERINRKIAESIELDLVKSNQLRDDIACKVKTTIQTWADSVNDVDGSPAVELPRTEVYEDVGEPHRVEVEVKHTVASAHFHFGDCGYAECEARRPGRAGSAGAAQTGGGHPVTEADGEGQIKTCVEDEAMICAVEDGTRRRRRSVI